MKNYFCQTQEKIQICISRFIDQTSERARLTHTHHTNTKVSKVINLNNNICPYTFGVTYVDMFLLFFDTCAQSHIYE